LDAARVDPARTTARNTRTSDQSRKSLCIFEEQHNVSTDTSKFFRPVTWLKHNPEDSQMTLTFPQMSLSNLIAFLRGIDPPQRSSWPQPQPMPETDRAQAHRALKWELLANNPEALHSDQGMMMLMALHPEHF